ncbi:hypothetical protein G7Y89_g13969 [Cudoniella acicularis]|uniref:Uncharacterized protein n=1 Tax=Cudoniella acicularis TaxID=354080 RepID=A0A8H4R9M0_9HELO|nr:hypothetical protein G7Y89_g13969 [Cudoniella acicularis]
MTRSQMQSAVIQYTLIATLNLIVSHEIGRNAYDDVWEDPVFKNLTTTIKFMAVNATLSNNNTSANITGNSNSLPADPQSFYFKILPQSIFVCALLFPLAYYWQIYLERFFPARPRGVEINYEKKEKVEVGEVNEGQEEEVVKRWIAQGKVRRSSVSWWNTFVKWVLDITVGNICLTVLRLLVEGLVTGNFKDTLSYLKSATLLSYSLSFISIRPFASLIGFIVVPVTKRIVFTVGIDTVEAVFVSSFLRLIVPLALRTEFIQHAMGNVTEGIMIANKFHVESAGNIQSIRAGGRTSVRTQPKKVPRVTGKEHSRMTEVHDTTQINDNSAGRAMGYNFIQIDRIISIPDSSLRATSSTATQRKDTFQLPQQVVASGEKILYDRSEPGTTQMIGLFLDPILVRIQLSGTEMAHTATLLGHVGARVQDALEHAVEFRYVKELVLGYRLLISW